MTEADVRELLTSKNTPKKYSIDELNFITWPYVSKEVELSEEFIKQYNDDVKWDIISEYQNLSEKFILENFFMLNKGMLQKNKHLSDDFKLLLKFKYL